MSTTASALTTEEYEERKQYLEELKGLVREEHEQIFRILKRGNVEFSENNNGVFFDISTVPVAVFDKLKEFMTLCRKTRDVFTERELETKQIRESLD
jgi:hypothetical protein